MNDIKIAVLLCGMPRTFQNCLENFRTIFGRYRPDIFGSIWDIDGRITSQKKYTADPQKKYLSQSPADVSSIGDSYHFQHLQTESWSDWIEESATRIKGLLLKHPSAGGQMLANGILGQYYKIQKCFSLIEDPLKYDLIVRWRFDIKANAIDFEDFTGSNKLYAGGSTQNTSIPSDHFFFGVPSVMSEVCSLYDFFLEMEPFDPKKHCLPHNAYIPEMVLSELLRNAGIDWQNIENPAQIFR